MAGAKAAAGQAAIARRDRSRAGIVVVATGRISSALPMAIGRSVRTRAVTGAGIRIGRSGRIKAETAAGIVVASGAAATGLTEIGRLTAIVHRGRMAAATGEETGAGIALMGIGRPMAIAHRVRMRAATGEASGIGRRVPAAMTVRRSGPVGRRSEIVLRGLAAVGTGPSGPVRRAMGLREIGRSGRVFRSHPDFAGISGRPA